tara:strand:- start:432 stop:1061 length:630 start_codon:yes stop_codon:yes gene_type:complete
MNRLNKLVCYGFLLTTFGCVYTSPRLKTSNVLDISTTEGTIITATTTKSTHPKTNKTYYWSRKRKINHTKGGYSGDLLHGKYTTYYTNGGLKEKGKFKKGLKQNEWVSWDQNGKIINMKTYSNGEVKGSFLMRLDSTTTIEGYINNRFIPRKVKIIHQDTLLSELCVRNGEVQKMLYPKNDSLLLDKILTKQASNQHDFEDLVQIILND